MSHHPVSPSRSITNLLRHQTLPITFASTAQSTMLKVALLLSSVLIWSTTTSTASTPSSAPRLRSLELSTVRLPLKSMTTLLPSAVLGSQCTMCILELRLRQRLPNRAPPWNGVKMVTFALSLRCFLLLEFPQMATRLSSTKSLLLILAGLIQETTPNLLLSLVTTLHFLTIF